MKTGARTVPQRADVICCPMPTALKCFVMLAAVAIGSAQVQPGPGQNNPVAPFRIADNVYYVGASDIASYLITSPAGHFIIDAGYEQTVPLIAANVKTLGFQLTDVKILLNTQAHFDHAAGFARL